MLWRLFWTIGMLAGMGIFVLCAFCSRGKTFAVQSFDRFMDRA